MTCAGLLHIRHVQTRSSFSGNVFVSTDCNDTGPALCGVDIGAACHCKGEQRERGSVAELHARRSSRVGELITAALAPPDAPPLEPAQIICKKNKPAKGAETPSDIRWKRASRISSTSSRA